MRIALTALACTITALMAQPAAAQQLVNERPDVNDPIMWLAEQNQPPGQFTLDNSNDVELVRFKMPHEVQLCAGRADPSAVFGTRRGYAIAATWDNDVAVIMPGNCLAFEASRLKVKPAGRLPDNVILTGSVRVLK